MTDEEATKFAIQELTRMQVINGPQDVLDSHRERVKKAYPAYFDTYDRMPELVDYLDSFGNLYCVGRNGQHRYNNMDHSMATAIEAVKDISFTVARDDAQTAKAILEELKESIGFKSIQVDDHVAKVSIVGAGMQSHSGVASKMFEAMSNNNINIKMISTSEIKISCIIDRADADKAVGAIHDMLFD